MLSKEALFGHFGVLEPQFREGDGTPLQYSCLESPMDGGAWWATVHADAKSGTQLSDYHFQLAENYRERQRRQWQPTPVLLPGKSHGQRSLVGCSPWDH